MKSVEAGASDSEVLQMGLECGYRVKNLGRGEARVEVVVDVLGIVVCFG